MKAYITLLSTDWYIDGTLCLYQSLKEVNSQYPLIVAISSTISQENRDILSKLNIDYIVLEDFSFNEECREMLYAMGAENWAETALKLRIFGLTQFEKLVYLDSDLLILKNIDELFDREHLTAAQDSPMIFPDKDHKLLNAGLMVIEPSKKIEEDLIEIAKNANMQDQDIIRSYYPNWLKQRKLHLPITFNIFAPFITNYLAQGIKEKDIRVLHFIGKQKPYNLSGDILSNNLISKYNRQYLSYIFQARQKLD